MISSNKRYGVLTETSDLMMSRYNESYDNHEQEDATQSNSFLPIISKFTPFVESSHYFYEIPHFFQKNDYYYAQHYLNNRHYFPTLMLSSVTCPYPGFSEYFSDYTYPQPPLRNPISSFDFFSSTSESDEPDFNTDTLIIIDWDDTLLPSSWLSSAKLSPEGSNSLSANDEHALNEMADMVYKTLMIASYAGQVVIVTNAEEGWIELSCQKFFPNLLGTLSQFRIISARSEYVGEPVFNPSLWKQQTFMNVIQEFEQTRSANTKINVISIGDSMHERSALINTQCELNSANIRPKSIKLIERPNIYQLKKEHEVIQMTFSELVKFEGVLDLLVFDLPILPLEYDDHKHHLSSNSLNSSFNMLSNPLDCPSTSTSTSVTNTADMLISVENYS